MFNVIQAIVGYWEWVFGETKRQKANQESFRAVTQAYAEARLRSSQPKEARREATKASPPSPSGSGLKVLFSCPAVFKYI